MNRFWFNNHITFFFFIVVLCNSVFSQEKTFTDSRGSNVPSEFMNSISVNFIEFPLKEVLHAIADKGEFEINYNENIIPGNISVTTKMTDRPAIEIMSILLHQYNLDFVMTRGDQLAIIKQQPGSREKIVEYFTLSGFIKDFDSGEVLIGTNIFVKDQYLGTASNNYGFYSITLPPGEYIFQYSFIGYSTVEVEFFLYEDIVKNIELNKASVDTDTVLVTGAIDLETYKSLEVGTVKLLPSQVSKTPSFLGERDLLKTLHLLPGIVKGREGDSGFFVRGGSPDQNLILLDEAPIYNAFHTFGFFSVINPDVIKNVKFFKGSAPAKYGGRISSILDIQMIDGNLREFEGQFGIGMIFSRLSLQGPIIKEKSSFMISGRRTYIDLFKGLSSDKDINNSKFYFYDLNMKVNFNFNNEDKLFLSGYLGRDALSYVDVFNMNWGNSTATFRWNHLFNNKLFLNTSLIYSHFTYYTFVYGEENDSDVEINSKIRDITFKQDYQYYDDTKNAYSFGFNYIYHSLLPGEIIVYEPDDFFLTIGKRDAHEISLYGSHQYSHNDKFTIDYGLRLGLFYVLGDPDIVDLNGKESKVYIDFHEAEKSSYLKMEPRLTATYLLDDKSSIKFGYSKNHQYLHMLSDNNSGTPLDVWQPSSSNIKPQSSDQFSLGYIEKILDDEYEFSAEIFYKSINNLIDYRDGANFVMKHFFESELVSGKGRSYGIELFLNKESGDLTGWISYSISRSEKEFEEINDSKPFPSRFDRTHDFSIVANYRLDKKWSFSANWVYSSGELITIPYGEYEIDGSRYLAYSPRNAYRLPAYHRLDVGISYKNDSGGVWNLTIYNAYARKNAYSLVFRRNYEVDFNFVEAFQYSLISILPSLSYTMNF